MGFLNRVYRTSSPSVWHHQLNAQGFFEVGLNRISVQAVKGDIHPFFFWAYENRVEEEQYRLFLWSWGLGRLIDAIDEKIPEHKQVLHKFCFFSYSLLSLLLQYNCCR